MSVATCMVLQMVIKFGGLEVVHWMHGQMISWSWMKFNDIHAKFCEICFRYTSMLPHQYLVPALPGTVLPGIPRCPIQPRTYTLYYWVTAVPIGSTDIIPGSFVNDHHLEEFSEC